MALFSFLPFVFGSWPATRAGRTSARCLCVSVAIFTPRPAISSCRSRSRLPMKADKIYLVGFMAAGKTTLARALAKRLDWRAVDIDELIEAREHDSVSGIFARHGEAYFRAVERAVLAEQLAPRHLVVATGGGTFADAQNR